MVDLKKWFKNKFSFSSPSSSSSSSSGNTETNQRTPLPKSVMAVLFFLLLFNAMTLTTVFSYVPKLVKSFGTSEVNAGKYAGLVASSMYVGQAIFSFLWGYLADTVGLKKITIVSCSCLGLTTLAFGFSSSFYWAVGTRFLQGCSIGLLVVCKSYISAICDNTNMAYGMAVITTSYYTGMVLGPAIGGYFVFPHHQYPSLFSEENIFVRFPVLLPNFLLFLGFLCSLISAIKFLPPDNNKSKNVESYLLDPEKKVKRYDNIMKDDLESSNNKNEDSFLTLSATNIIVTSPSTTSVCYFQMVESDKALLLEDQIKKSTFKEKWQRSKFRSLVSNKWCMLSCLLYCCFGYYSIGYDELPPLFLATSLEYNGLAFTTGDIGTALLIASLTGIVIQATLLPFVLQGFGAKRVHLVTMVISLICLPFLPLTKELYYNKIALWVLLCVHQTIIRTCLGGTFLSVNMMINNSVPRDLVGSANGIAMAIAAFGRLLSPTINGSIFSWSLSNVKGVGNPDALGFPFNQFFPFFFLSAFGLCSFVFACFFPRWLNEQYKTSKVCDDNLKIGSGGGKASNFETRGKKVTNFSLRYSRLV